MQSGQMLVHYRIEALLGRGGMGEVWRARDTKLDREVALKILPPEFAADPERAARFEREAKVLASLNHPHIAAIHGFERTPEVTFLVMELVEGEDLAQILARGPLPVDEAVAIAKQIADGLEDAHESGIVHRDLKPANVKRTPDGKVKILDFGLARAFAGQTAGEGSVSNAPTLTAAFTAAGTVLGTAAYMSPEQARGKEVDRRTDIWAFGVILFEMLTGKRLFDGETATDTLAGILKTDPDWKSLPDGLPRQVLRVLKRCLTKDPRQRLRDIGEARVRLENPEAESGMFTGAFPAAATAPSRWRAGLPWALLAVSLALVAWFALSGGIGGGEQRALHLALPRPDGFQFTLDPSSPGIPTVSPDGRQVVFSAKPDSGGASRLYVRSLDSGRSVALDGTDGAQYPFWSPDSRWIGFYDLSEGLKKIPAGGGPTQTVCKAAYGKGASWSTRGEILFTTDYNTPISVVAAVGGEPREVTSLKGDAGVGSHRHPQFLPDGRHFLYLARGSGGHDSQLRLADLDGEPTRTIMTTPYMARYASGRLLFMADQTLMAQAFDPGKGDLSGAPVPVATDVLLITGAALAAYSASDEGTLVYLTGESSDAASLVWMDRTGAKLGQLGDEANYQTVQLSPDNRRAAVTIVDPAAGTNDIWIYEIARNFRTRFTNDPANESFPVWQPDGRALLFVSDRAGHPAIYRQALGGTGETELVLDTNSPTQLFDCTDGGRTIIYAVRSDSLDYDLWSAAVAGDQEPRLLRRTRYVDVAGIVSPDGKWIGFASNASGHWQDYLAPWPQMTPLTQVTTNSGTYLCWNRDSRELICQTEGGKLLSIGLDPADGELNVALPRPLFDLAETTDLGVQFDLAADGERFLAVNPSPTRVPPYCDVVVDWPAKMR